MISAAPWFGRPASDTRRSGRRYFVNPVDDAARSRATTGASTNRSELYSTRSLGRAGGVPFLPVTRS